MAADLAEDRDFVGSAAAQQFNFWIGAWDIQQRILGADGSWLEFPAETAVSPTLAGLALIEHWRGTVQFFWEGMESPAEMEGLSIRAYDEKSKVWKIHWMDSRHPILGEPYKGTFAAGGGTFFRSWQTEEGESRQGRIRFRDIQSDTVRWDLAVSSGAAQHWSVLWIMEMRRARA